MLRWEWKNKMGELMLKDNKGEYKVNIYRANCLFALIYQWHDDHNNQDMYNVYCWCNDAEHLKRMLGIKKIDGKAKDIFDGIFVSARMNIAYKEVMTIAKLFVTAGHEVTLFHEPIKDLEE